LQKGVFSPFGQSSLLTVSRPSLKRMFYPLWSERTLQ